MAVDWINDKLYWVDSVWARIEVMDISVGGNGERAELIKLSNHTIPRGIAVDPNVRLGNIQSTLIHLNTRIAYVHKGYIIIHTFSATYNTA